MYIYGHLGDAKLAYEVGGKYYWFGLDERLGSSGRHVMGGVWASFS